MAWDIGFDQASSSSSSTSTSSSSSSSSLSSLSSSSSSSSCSEGTIVYGEVAGVGIEEDIATSFLNNWTTSGGWTPSGSGSLETFRTDNTCAQVSVSLPHCLGAFEAAIDLDKYRTGSGPAPKIEYKTSATKAGLSSESWTEYNGSSFTSLGWIKLRITHIKTFPLRVTQARDQRVTEGDVGTIDRITE